MTKIIEICLPPMPENDIMLPMGARTMGVAARKKTGSPDYTTALYFEVDPANLPVKRHVAIRTANMDLSGKEGRYVGSATMYPAEDVVLHVYLSDEGHSP
jgi:hypothetical protein